MLLINNRSVTDPFVNLALEEYLVREPLSDEPLLLLYVNDPCVVLGKNQSVWSEVNLPWMLQGGTVARRVSGGGTVYHDSGNLNISFIFPFEEKLLNNYRHINARLFTALQSLSLPVSFSDRNDILCDGKKISGNAQFTNRKRILSHCTLLVNADMNALRTSLKPNEFMAETKAVSSVRSSVANVCDWLPEMSVAEAILQITQAHGAGSELNLSDRQWSEVLALADSKYRSFDWVMARNPRTVLRHGEKQMEIVDGHAGEVLVSPQWVAHFFAL